MDPSPDRIVRRDFLRTPDGYDPAAVDAHLEAVAALVADAPSGPGASAADHALLAAGRLLLDQISALRVELRNVSASLRDQGLAISETLDRLLDLDDAPGPPSPEPPAASGSGADPVGSEAPRPPVDPRPALGPEGTATGVPPPPREEAVAPAPPPPPGVPGDAAPAAEVDPSTVADARLVALDMALGGSDRDEIGRELGRRFGLPEPFALADQVLAALG